MAAQHARMLAGLVLCLGPALAAAQDDVEAAASGDTGQAAEPTAEEAPPGETPQAVEPAAAAAPAAAAVHAAPEPVPPPAAEAAPSVAPAPASDPTPDGEPADEVLPAEEIIEDPELDGLPPPAPDAGSEAPTPSPEATSGNARVRAVLRSRVATDVSWQDPREDVWEATQLALLEATVRRSERLRFSVGLALRHHFAARDGATPDAEAARYELDASPTAAYADATVADGVHLRLGYQSLLLGRFDVLGGTNILAVYDLRAGPTTLPEGAEIAQPAARMDWDVDTWLSLRLVYVPFFKPHRIAVSEGDYALLRVRQSDVDAANVAAAAAVPGLDAADIALRVRESFSRSGGARLAEGAFDAFAPDPSLAHPQGAVRLVAHGPLGELGATAVTARERLPALAYSQAFLDWVADDTSETRAVLLADPRPIEVRYQRLSVFALDAASALGPVGVGLELAYVHDRTLFAAREGEAPLPEQADLAQASLRLEHISGSTWLVGMEALVAHALQAATDPTRRYMFLEAGRTLYGVAGMVAFGLGEGAFTLELAGGFYSGPSYLVMPRAELRLVDGLFAEVGAYVVEGATPGPLGSADIALGGLYDDVDQVFLGLRWLP